MLCTFVSVASLLLATSVQGVTVDLSADFELSLNNPGADLVSSAAAAFPEIRTALVLEHGKIVAEYARNDVDPDAPYQVWSTTKSWISLLVGIMVESNLISLNETLGEIFEQDSVWNAVNETEFRQNVTIQSLLTMTSGLVNPVSLEQWGDPMDGGDAGGGTLAGSLEYPSIGLKGNFSYLAASNIMSYVIQERTGKSPREYAADRVFPSLGMQDSEISWWLNEDGMEYSYHGLELTAYQMAKFGQLYLQGGLSAPNKPLVSSDWISNSTFPQTNAYLEFLPGQSITGQYGYLLWIMNGTTLGFPNFVSDFYCAIGIGGQDICVHPELDRVSVQQRDWQDFSGNLIMAAVAFDENISFESNTTDTSGTSWWRPGMIGLLLLSLIVSTF